MNILERIFAGAKAFIYALADILPKWVKKVAPQMLAFTTQVRNVLEALNGALHSDTAELIQKLIKAQWDDKSVKWLEDILAKVIPQLVNLENCNGDFECMIQVLVDWIKGENQAGQEMKLQKLLSLMLEAEDDGKLKRRYYDQYGQSAFTVHSEGLLV